MSEIDDVVERGAPPDHHDTPDLPSDQHPSAAPTISRRRALTILGATAITGASALAQQPAQQRPRQTHEAPNQPATSTRQAQSTPTRKFLNAREYRTVRVLGDDVIPRDARSGSASDAGVPDFIDFHLSVEETSADTRLAWRGGLRWLDTETRRRFGVPYASATRAQRHQVLDDIAFAERATPAMQPGAAFFARFRDLCAAGFFSSAAGWKDLEYIGNTFVPVWTGCPAPALAKLDVSYALMDTRIPPR